jgi:hypothetical protein
MPPGHRIVLRGTEITEMLCARGAPSWRHQIVDGAQDGALWLLEGAVIGGTLDASFLVAIELDSSGMFRSYEAFRSDGRVARTHASQFEDRPSAAQFRATIEGWWADSSTYVRSDGDVPNPFVDSMPSDGQLEWLGVLPCEHVAVGTRLGFALGSARGHAHERYRFMMSADRSGTDSWEHVLLCWAVEEAHP